MSGGPERTVAELRDSFTAMVAERYPRLARIYGYTRPLEDNEIGETIDG